MTDFDVSAHRQAYYRFVYRGREVISLVFGIAFFLIAVVAMILYITTGIRDELIAVGIISVSAAALLAAWAANRSRSGKLIQVVKIDADAITFVPVRGPAVRMAWADPMLELNLGDFQHPTMRPSNAGFMERYFVFKDAQIVRVWGSLSEDALRAILDGARQRGLAVQQALKYSGQWYEALAYFIRGKDAPPPPADFNK